MSDMPKHAIDTSKAPAAQPQTGKKSGSVLATVIALLGLGTAVGGIAAGYYVYEQEIKPVSGRIESVVEALRAEHKQAETKGAQTLQQALATVETQTGELFAGQETLRADLGSIHDDISILRYKANWGQREWSLAEIGFLLRMAQDRLTYMRDVETTKAALRTAVARLEQLADPALVPLQQQIRNDLQALNAYVTPGPTHVLARLEGMVEAIKPFPVPLEGGGDTPVAVTPEAKANAAEPDQAPQASGWRSFLSDAKAELQNRVRVVRHGEPLNAMTHNTVERYQLELLDLRLEALRFALLREDAVSFRRELLAIQTWVNANLTPRHATMISGELDALRATDPFQPLPSLKSSLAMMKSLLAEPVPEAAPEAAAPAALAEPAAVIPSPASPVSGEMPQQGEEAVPLPDAAAPVRESGKPEVL